MTFEVYTCNLAEQIQALHNGVYITFWNKEHILPIGYGIRWTVKGYFLHLSNPAIPFDINFKEGGTRCLFAGSDSIPDSLTCDILETQAECCGLDTFLLRIVCKA